MFEFMIDLPVKVAFGAGKLKDLGALTARYGKKAFFLYDPYLKGTPMLTGILENLKDNGIACVEFDDVEPNPRNTTIDRAAKLCVDQGCDVVVSMGGGSAIDSAKAVAVVAKNGGNSWEYTRNATGDNKKPEKGKLPLLVIPTTSGTGTETTPFAVVNNAELHYKATIVEDECYPTVAIVDPEVTASLPPLLTALTGIDTFAHCIEAYMSSIATPFSDIICLQGIRLFLENIKECCKNGSNLEARANLALASTLGGIGIGHACTTMPHSVAQAFGGIMDAPHGGAIATCTKAVIKWTLPHGKEKYAKVAELVDPSIATLSVEEKAAMLPDLLDNLFTEILGGEKVNMRTYGLKEEQMEDVLNLVMERYYGDCELHPKVPTREDLLAVIKESF